MRLFFGGTTMGGGKLKKPVVYFILQFENRQLYYLINNTPIEYHQKLIHCLPGN